MAVRQKIGKLLQRLGIALVVTAAVLGLSGSGSSSASVRVPAPVVIRAWVSTGTISPWQGGGCLTAQDLKPYATVLVEPCAVFGTDPRQLWHAQVLTGGILTVSIFTLPDLCLGGRPKPGGYALVWDCGTPYPDVNQGLYLYGGTPEHKAVANRIGSVFLKRLTSPQRLGAPAFWANRTGIFGFFVNIHQKWRFNGQINGGGWIEVHVTLL